ncbi:cell envelope biogenesis protein OmpA [Bacteroidia bacterium]|nr:cell envelope biogenesis protein OmpA [Bacteroidia bacterium]
MKKILILFALCTLHFALCTLHAQVTTSTLTGKVSDANGTMPGATIVASHTPSGTSYGAVTNGSGVYTIQGMRAGGPYTVTVSFMGFATKTYTDINIPLGETFKLDAEMQAGTQELEAVSVVGNRSQFAVEKTGASTNISNQELRLMPTINRSLGDIARLSPYAGANNSFSGRDGRSTNFTVDGANLNNNFGLSDALPGGGNPISLEAIDEMQVVVAPFDVRQSNFIGGGINAVTKSGTNSYKGTVYTYFTNQNMRGNKIGTFKPEEDERPKEGKQIYGAAVGGPIIKDKLFFFANFEYENSPKQITDWHASSDGVADGDNFISHARQSDLDLFSQLLKERYGYETGSSTNFPGGISNMKALARIDWNINKSHKLSLRYNYTKNDNWIEPNGNSSDNGYRLNGTNRIGIDAMSYINSCYSTANAVHSVSAELNSNFGSKFNNELRATYTNINDQRGTKSSPFPFIDIMNGDDVGDPYNYNNFKPYMSAGLELFTWNNGVANQVATITDNFTTYLGTHKLTAGVNFEYQFAKNSYMRNGTGYYRFFSFSDFINGADPEAFALTYGYDGEKNPAGKVSYAQTALYLQDEWDVADNFKLTYGLRVDNTSFLNKMLENKAISALNFGGDSINVGKWPGSKWQLEPRIGFNWDVDKEKSLTVRGGTGLFAGRIPLVFFTNMPQNAGMIQGASNQIFTKYNADGSIVSVHPGLAGLYDGNGLLLTNVDDMIAALGLNDSISPEDGTIQSNMAGVDPNFKMPQVWKTSLALDYKVPTKFPFTISVEGMFNRYINDICLRNINVKDQSTANGYFVYDGPDQRWIANSQTYQYYANNAAHDADYKKSVGVLGVLTNTNKGYGWTVNATITMQPVKNLNLMAAYTHTESYEVSGMPGSNATSAWQGLPTVEGPNFNGPQWSQYVTPDRFVAALNYTIEYGKGMFGGATEFGLFYQAYSPYRYSYVYSNDFNGDGINQDLIYIPETKDEIMWKTDADADRFWDYLKKDKYLSSHKGQYAEAYKAYAPFVHRFDLHFAQNFHVKAGKTKNTLQVSLDILNIGNLFMSEWGVNKEMNYAVTKGTTSASILKFEGVNKDGVAGTEDDNTPYFSFAPTSKINKIYDNYNQVSSQTWKIQVGIRYIFN